ncbi:MAG: 1-acyl-sn-glycerol-3-phosphate acyltransferase [Bacteroidales bacterium]|nr:1-acyl-sn-glycerol-3-phosphate acyltransferase [Bacteroidales bacterium]
MAALADQPLAAKLFPDLSHEALKQRFLAYDGVRSFQSDAMYRACQYLIQTTITDFSCSGTQYLDGQPSLFISNHRDIVVDSLLLQYQLVTQGLDTSYIVIGSNLFEMPLMAQMAKVNKMIGIPRASGGKAFYNSMMQLSRLLRTLVVGQGQSVWIAQRNGRTKDGIDHTDPALIKMISRSDPDPVRALETLHIVPLSISYEWEPCAPQKARELLLSAQGPYTKQPGEDTQSILSGLSAPKGHVHLTVCQPLSSTELEELHGSPDGVASLIDSRIAQGYTIYDNSRLAAALLAGSPIKHTPQLLRFEHYLDEACSRYPLGPDIRQTLLGIYAAPLQKLKIEK